MVRNVRFSEHFPDVLNRSSQIQIADLVTYREEVILPRCEKPILRESLLTHRDFLQAYNQTSLIKVGPSPSKKLCYLRD